jgi:hypothetical protein
MLLRNSVRAADELPLLETDDDPVDLLSFPEIRHHFEHRRNDDELGLRELSLLDSRPSWPGPDAPRRRHGNRARRRTRTTSTRPW